MGPRSLVVLFFTKLLNVILGRKYFAFKLSLASPVSTSVMAAATPVTAVVITTVCLGRPIAKGGIVNVFLNSVKTLALVLDDRNSASKGNKDVPKSLLYLLTRVDFSFCLTVFGKLVDECGVFALVG